MRSARSRAAGVIAAVVLGSAGAAAQPGGSAAVAEALFQQGRDLAKIGRYGEACPKLAESQRLDPKLGTLLNLALCNEQLGKTATAWAAYTSAAAIARREGQKEREDFAREHVTALEKQLGHVVLQISAAEAGLTVSLDDSPMSSAALSIPLPVDPGRHRIAATAPGKKAWSREIEVPPSRAEVLVPIPVLEAAPEVTAPPPPPAPPAPIVAPPPIVPGPPPAPAPPPGRNDAVILMGTGFGVGAVGVIVGAIAGSVTLSNAQAIRSKCPDNVCSSTESGPLASANTLANVANVGFILGAAGVVIGVIGVVLRPREPATRVTITPIVGPGVAGLRGNF